MFVSLSEKKLEFGLVQFEKYETVYLKGWFDISLGFSGSTKSKNLFPSLFQFILRSQYPAVIFYVVRYRG